MKIASYFYALLFVFLISPIPSLAANIELKDNPIGDQKQVLVNIDSEGEQTRSIKLAIEFSEGVTISNIEEGDGFCSTFSSSPNGLLVEIMCTMTQDTILDGTLAKIEFKATSDDYTFKVLEDKSLIGELDINKVVNIGSKEDGDEETTLAETNEEDLTTNTSNNTAEAGNQAPVSSSTGGVTVGNVQEKSSLKKVLPYIFLGGAGLFLVSIIVLLVTKKKDDVVLADVPASTTIVNAEAQAITDTSEQEMPETPIKQKLNEIIKPVDITTPEETTTQENVVSENSDLQDLLANEVNNTGTDLPITNNVTNSAEITSDIADNYQANVTEETLPNIGSTSPIDGNGNLETNVLPQVEAGPQPEIIPQIPQIPIENTFQTQESVVPPIQPEVIPQIPIENTFQDTQTLDNPVDIDAGGFPQPEVTPQAPIDLGFNQTMSQVEPINNFQDLSGQEVVSMPTETPTVQPEETLQTPMADSIQPTETTVDLGFNQTMPQMEPTNNFQDLNGQEIGTTGFPQVTNTLPEDLNTPVTTPQAPVM